jgi:asparagine synthase (glutamine-hydrolysing)
MGFGVPVARWLRDELREWVHDLLLSRGALAGRLFSPPAVRALVDGHAAGRDHGAQLWALLVLEIWARRSRTESQAGRGVA